MHLDKYAFDSMVIKKDREQSNDITEKDRWL